MSAIIAQPGFCLPDKEMKRLTKDKKLVEVDWTELDYTLSRLHKQLIKVAKGYDPMGEHIIPERTPVSNQLNIGSCVANAWCDALEILDGLEGTDEIEQLSRLFLYYLSRYLHSATDQDKGTYLRAAAHQLRKIGVVLEKYFKYEHANVFPKEVALDLYTLASNNRLVNFYRVVSNGLERLEELELAVRANHPVVFGAPVSQQFCDYRGDNTVFTRPDDWVGRHAMIITGVRKRVSRFEFLLRNSWGLGWGDDGHVWVDQDFVDWDEFEDIWVGTKMPALI
jgi:C1A family cysteine protease